MERNELVYREVAEHFTKCYNVDIQWQDIANALDIHTSLLEHPVEIWDIEVDVEGLKKILADYNFVNPIIPVDIDIPLPKEIMFQTKVRIKVKGNIYIVHKNDADLFPSNPHAHIDGQCIKVDLSNGDLYRKKELKGRINKKEFLIIRDKLSEVYDGDLPALTI